MSNVRQMQPSAAICCARPRSRSRQPPQPCTNSTPGMVEPGASTVPARWVPSTAMSVSWLRVVIVLHHGAFEQGTAGRIGAVEQHRRALRRMGVGAVALLRAHAEPAAAGLVAKTQQRGGLRPAGAADTPGRLEHARVRLAAVVLALHHVVVAPRGEHAGEALPRDLVVELRLGDRLAYRRW